MRAKTLENLPVHQGKVTSLDFSKELGIWPPPGRIRVVHFWSVNGEKSMTTISQSNVSILFYGSELDSDIPSHGQGKVE